MKESKKSVEPTNKRILIVLTICTVVGMVAGWITGLHNIPQLHLYYTIPVGGALGYWCGVWGLTFWYSDCAGGYF
jgi:hypothetical protein